MFAQIFMKNGSNNVIEVFDNSTYSIGKGEVTEIKFTEKHPTFLKEEFLKKISELSDADFYKVACVMRYNPNLTGLGL